MFDVISGFNSLVELLKTILIIPKYIEKLKYGPDYYFEEYNKQITIYKDGHGILATSFKVKVLNPAKFVEIKRKLNISDGKKSTKFKKLKEMQKTNKEQRFSELGFWYTSEDNIVTSVKEFYFSDSDSSKEDRVLRENPKELRWIFKLNSGKIKKNKTYTISYAISVPGMFPISDGVFDEDSNPFKSEYGDFVSSLKVNHAMKKVVYTVALESGIKITDDLQCVVIDHKKDGSEKKIPLNGELHDNIFYDKYTYVIDNPHINSDIKINWNIMHVEATSTQKQEAVV